MNVTKEPEAKVQECNDLNEMREAIVSLEKTVQELKEEVKKVRKQKRTFDFGEMEFWIIAIVIAIGWFWGK
ncbi:phosphodiesterase [Bacillus sp. C1]